MRLIDAEKCPCKGCVMTYCNENCKKYYAWLDGCDYDVEAKVAELEKASYRTENTFDEDGYCNDDSEEVVELHTAISIVRGKE